MREAEALNGFNQLGRAETAGISTPLHSIITQAGTRLCFQAFDKGYF